MSGRHLEIVPVGYYYQRQFSVSMRGLGKGVMLSLTRKADYALVAVVHLAREGARGAGPISARGIARRFDLPLPLLMNVLKQLAGAGVLRSTRGAGGGYELVVRPTALSVLDVMEAVSDTEFVGNGDASGVASSALGRLDGRLRGFLRQATLADLIREADKAELTAVVPLRMHGASESGLSDD